MYNPTTWKNGSSPDVDEDNLNNIERGIKEAHEMAEKNTKNLEAMAGNQMPQEYVKKAVDDYVAENNAGLATKENLERLDIEMSNEIEGRERIKWGNTPFYVMNYPLTETYKRFFEDGSERTLERCSKIRPCPKHIGFNLKGNSRMFLYIGDMVDGQFVPDENYFIITTSAGAYNYFNPANNRILTVEEGKYFYYSIDVDDGYELIYGDSFPDTKLHADGYTPYYTTYGTGKLYYSKDYYSLFIPNGCWYMILTENKPSNYERNNILLSTTVDVTEESERYYNTIGTPSFGYIDKDLGSTLLRLPDGCNPEDIQLYLAPDNVHSTCSVGIQERAVDIAGTMIDNFKFKSKKAIIIIAAIVVFNGFSAPDNATFSNLKLILSSTKNSLLGDPDFGSLLRNKLFEQNTPLLQDLIIDDIYTTILTFMPQLALKRSDITVSSNGIDLFVTIKFSRLPKDILVQDYGVGMKVFSKE